MAENRVVRYKGMTTPIHLVQIDSDLDNLFTLIGDVKTEMREGFKACEDRDTKGNKMQVAILSSLVVAALLLVANVILLGGPN